jgi:membrane-bound ClpP family serine protease
MSEEGDTFFVNLAEKFLGLILIVLGAILIYLTATTSGSSGLGAFDFFFGVLSVILLLIGLFLLLVRASE